MSIYDINVKDNKGKVVKCINLNEKDALKLYELLHKILYNVREGDK